MFNEFKFIFKEFITWLVLGLAAGLPMTAATGQERDLPLEFEVNRGQFAPQVLFLARTAGHFIYLTREGMTLGVNASSRRGAALEMQLVGANPAAGVTSEGILPGISNYFIGNDPSVWRREVPHYARVRYRSAWPGIDVIFRGGEQLLEYDLVVSPGADPSSIRLRFANATGVRLDGEGALLIDAAAGRVIQRLPEIYQEREGKRQPVNGRFRVRDNREIRFEVGTYDPKRPLVIDPTITYANYLGGTGTITVSQIAVDSAGSAYIAGSASSPDFPLVTPVVTSSTNVGLFRSSNQGASWGAASSNIGTAKVLSLAADPSTAATAYAGTSRGVFKTTNSGSSWIAANSGLPSDSVTSVAVDPLAPSTLYVCMPEGTYKSTNGAATWIALANAGACQVVAADFNREGTIWLGYQYGFPIVSFDGGQTFLEANYGQIPVTSVAIDPSNSNNVFFGTTSNGLVMTNNGGQSFTPVLAGLQTTNLSEVSINAVAVDKRNSQHILVGTDTGVYLSVNGGAQFLNTGGLGVRDVLSVLFDPNNDSIALAGTAGGGVYVSADGGRSWTPSGPALLDVSALAMSIDETSTWAGLYSGTNAFVTKINAAGTAEVYSTYLGGSGATLGNAIGVDSAGHAFVCGQTVAPDFPVRNAYQPESGGGSDFFVSRLSAAGSSLDASTYLGGHADDVCNGLAIDSSGNVYLAGTTILLNSNTSSDFPTTPGVLGPKSFGEQDCVVAKFDNGLQKPIYSSFLGGESADTCYAVAADSSGNAYVTGVTFSSHFLVTQPPFGGTLAAGSPTTVPAFVAEIKPDGSALVYSGLLGGAKGATQMNAIAVNSAGRAFVAGYTQASDYPFTGKALNTTVVAAGKSVVTAIEAGGANLVYSTLLPGAGPDFGTGIAIDSNSDAWVGGADRSGSFPVSADALPHTPAKGSTTPYLAELDPTGSTLLHATYLAGSAGGGSPVVAVGSDGSLYVAGTTASTDFSITGTPLGKSTATGYTLFFMRLVFPSVGGGGSGSGGTGAGPSISAVQNGASFQNGIAANSWMTIKGSNLSTVTDTWANAIVNGQLPTKLDGVTVTVGGQPAYIYFVSSGQINVVAPNVPPGPVNVIVSNSLGTSAAFNATVQAEQPAFFQIPPTVYAVATRQDYSVALKNGTIAGATTVPAAPGDVIILWGTGFGPTNPAAPQGAEVPASAFPTATPVTVTVGNQPATVYGAALASGLAGVYQVAIQIPASLPNGDYPIVATIDGQASPVTTLITVQK